MLQICIFPLRVRYIQSDASPGLRSCDGSQHTNKISFGAYLVAMQGIEPEIRTYNTVIIACNMSGQAQEALKVYERMLTAGALPTATTYTALISAYGKNGQLDRALQIFEDMVCLTA